MRLTLCTLALSAVAGLPAAAQTAGETTCAEFAGMNQATQVSTLAAIQVAKAEDGDKDMKAQASSSDAEDSMSDMESGSDSAMSDSNAPGENGESLSSVTASEAVAGGEMPAQDMGEAKVDESGKSTDAMASGEAGHDDGMMSSDSSDSEDHGMMASDSEDGGMMSSDSSDSEDHGMMASDSESGSMMPSDSSEGMMSSETEDSMMNDADSDDGMMAEGDQGNSATMEGDAAASGSMMATADTGSGNGMAAEGSSDGAMSADAGSSDTKPGTGAEETLKAVLDACSGNDQSTLQEVMAGMSK